MSIDEHDILYSAPLPGDIPIPAQTSLTEDINMPLVEGEGSNETPSPNPWDEDDEDIEVPDEEVPDEEVPDESEEPFTAKYNIKNPLSNGDAYIAAGDQAQLHQHTTYHTVTNRYDHLQIIMEAKQSVGDDQQDIFRDIRDLIKQTLALTRQNSVVLTQKTQPGDKPLPHTHDMFSTWFYDLDEYEQCYAQAAALLHGTAASDVSKYADDIYLLSRTQQNTIVSSSSEALLQEQKASLLSLHNRSKRDLQMRTFTITQRVDGVERLYWRDVQSDGSSSFHLQFLDFLAGEYQSKGLYGQEVLKQVGAWAQVSNAELFQCIARALGVFLWHQNKSALRSQANEWAQKPSAIRWQRTSILLDAAYEIDIMTYPEHENDRKTSPVLNILAEWVERTQKMGSKADVYKGCAAANTYALIGKRQREVALSGLAQLLQFSVENLVEIEKLQAAVVSAYFTLSWSGHIYHILCHLSTMAEQSLLQQTRPEVTRLRRCYRLQCQLRLKVCLDAFFFIALDALSSATLQCAITYQQPVSALPSLQERQQRDIILAGILATDETGQSYWRKEALQLLSIAIIERSSHTIAFDLLFRWANALLQMQDIDSAHGSLLITSFQTFLFDLGHVLHRWCLDLQRQNRPSPAFQVYKNRLGTWSQKKDAFGKLFRQVAYQLNKRYREHVSTC
jgi:hypothetical protein